MNPTKIDRLLADSKKIKKIVTPFDKNSVKKIVKIFYPECTGPHMKKAYKIVINYIDNENKKREKTILFGDKNRKGCEYVDHHNKEVRDKYLKTLTSSDTFFDINFMNKTLLNGEMEDITSNWNILKEKYL
jgi:hypothetical protein